DGGGRARGAAAAPDPRRSPREGAPPLPEAPLGQESGTGPGEPPGFHELPAHAARVAPTTACGGPLGQESGTGPGEPPGFTLTRSGFTFAGAGAGRWIGREVGMTVEARIEGLLGKLEALRATDPALRVFGAST